MISRLILITCMNIPTTTLLPIHTHKIPLPDIIREIVLGHIASIREQKRLILNLWGISVQREIRQFLVFIRVEPMREASWVETPQGAEDGNVGKCFVDKVLVCARKIGVDDPVQVAKGRGEGNVDIIGRVGDHGCGCVYKVGFSVWRYVLTKHSNS
jgi:hypothetical protein